MQTPERHARNQTPTPKLRTRMPTEFCPLTLEEEEGKRDLGGGEGVYLYCLGKLGKLALGADSLSEG